MSGTKLTLEQIELFLNSPSTLSDGTWRECFALLLKTLYSEGECFSGKRPLGNSGWEYDIIRGLICVAPSVATLDGDEELDEVDHELAQDFVSQIVDYVFGLNQEGTK